MRPREALTEILQLLIKEYAGWQGRIVSQIVAEGQSDPEVLRKFGAHRRVLEGTAWRACAQK